MLIAACAGNPSAPESTYVAQENENEDKIPAYSDLTRAETLETLKRLQSIRKKLSAQRSTVYRGPIRHVWDRILAKPLIQHKDNLRIEKQATVLLRDQKFLHRVSLRAEPYAYFILEEIDKRNLPRELLLLPVIESGYRPNALSRSMAMGLWQFIPSTSRFLGMKRNYWYDARRDIITSTKQALDYLQDINQMFDGNWLLTLAAYNAGHGTVRKAIIRNKKRGLPTDYWNLKLPSETMNYVPRFLAASRIFTHPEDYGVSLKAVKNEPRFAITKIRGQLTLQEAANMAGISLAEVKIYNPGFLRMVTAPKGPHRLVLPLSSISRFKQELARQGYQKPLHVGEHRVASGDTLSIIARKHHTNVMAIKSINNLQGSLIRIGQILKIPSTGKVAQTPASTVKTQATRSHPAKPSDNEYYIVKAGDTVWRIAQLHQISPETLLSLNGLNEKSVIQPGQRLRVKAKASTPSSVALSS